MGGTLAEEVVLNAIDKRPRGGQSVVHTTVVYNDSSYTHTTHTHIHVYTYTHIRTLPRTHTHTHMHMHMHTRACIMKSRCVSRISYHAATRREE
jgi:hypothetical protein